MSETLIVTKAWKGFDKEMSCRGHKFEVGETYSIDGIPVVCERGFHACTSPLDVLSYYSFGSGSRYAEVELIGATVTRDDDSKVAASSIRIVREITYAGLWAAHRAWLQEALKEDAATGYGGHASATGYGGHASATGDGGHASATGVRGHASATGVSGHASATGVSGHASATGYGAIAIAVGVHARAKSTDGSWIVLARYTEDGELVEVKTAKIGDGALKPHTWYRLGTSGEFEEVPS